MWNTDRHEVEELKQLVSRYCNRIDELKPAAYDFREWDETLTIGARGDTHAKANIRLRVRQPDLMFVRLKFACGRPQSARIRRLVRTTVRGLLVDGSPGTKLQTTCRWTNDRTTDVIVHLPSPQKAGTEVSFTVDLDWPRRFAPLLSGVPTEFTVVNRHPAAHVVHRVVLPAGTSSYLEPIGNPAEFAELRAKTAEDGSDRETVIFELFGVPARQRVGVRLELKESAP